MKKERRRVNNMGREAAAAAGVGGRGASLALRVKATVSIAGVSWGQTANPPGPPLTSYFLLVGRKSHSLKTWHVAKTLK